MCALFALSLRIMLMVFFFFQAEDGIRDLIVTGVQTCALPICRIFPKQGNETVLVYAVASRRTLAEKVVPYLRDYMKFAPRKAIYHGFCDIVEAMERKEHHTPQGMAGIVQKAETLKPGAKGKSRKRPLQEVIDRILRDYTPDSGEMPEKI